MLKDLNRRCARGKLRPVLSRFIAVAWLGCALLGACGRSFPLTPETGPAASSGGTGIPTTASGTTSGGASITGTGTTAGIATAGTATTGGMTSGQSSTTGTGTTTAGNGGTGTGASTTGTATGGNCDPGQCVFADGTCGWEASSGPCGLTGVAGNLNCCAGLTCQSDNICEPGLPNGAACNGGGQCLSGVCGTTGVGNCCATSCTTGDPICGATGCDTSGACLYPSNATPCTAGSCSNDIQTNPSLCNGQGTCTPPSTPTTSCAPFLCGTTTCLTTCTDDTSCVSGGFCDRGNTACCSGLISGGNLNVDGVSGNDRTPCCGIGAFACQTLSKAMTLIDEAQASNVTVHVTVDGGEGDWTAPEAAYPVVLGWGVELSAPGIYFHDPSSWPNGPPNAAIFDVGYFSNNDTVGYASIVGTAANPIGVGMNTANTEQTDDFSTLSVEAGKTLYIANAVVNSSRNSPHSLNSILLSGTAGLWLGQDQSALTIGAVAIGNALGQQSTDGYKGIVCATDGLSDGGCTIQDVPLPTGQATVSIQGQAAVDLDVEEDFSSVSLTATPVIGAPPAGVGIGMCAHKDDGVVALSGPPAAIIVGGATTLTFTNGIVQCIGGEGFELSATAFIDGTTIQNTDLGIYVTAGTASVSNTTIRNNFIGVQQDQTGVLDLGDGGNSVTCSSNAESSQDAGAPGIDVYNTGTANLNASNTAWDTAGPDYFQCDSAFTSCSCNLSSCTVAPGADGMDAVEDSTNLGGITTTGNTQSPSGCP